MQSRENQKQKIVHNDKFSLGSIDFEATSSPHSVSTLAASFCIHDDGWKNSSLRCFKLHRRSKVKSSISTPFCRAPHRVSNMKLIIWNLEKQFEIKLLISIVESWIQMSFQCPLLNVFDARVKPCSATTSQRAIIESP